MGSFEPKVLRNRGVPVQVYKVWRPPVELPANITPEILKAAGTEMPLGDAERLLDSDQDPVFEQRHLKMTLRVMAELEDLYGTIEDWQDAMSKAPLRCVSRTMACCFDVDEATVDLMVDETQSDWYSSAIGVAWALANGMDPMKATVLLERERAVAAAAAAKADRLEAPYLESTSPGATGTAPGEPSA